jgi:hypothetical protein
MLPPATLRPVIGVTVALVGRDSHDYRGGSVTIGVVPRRPSRLPYAIHVLGCRRCIIHHLTSTHCARLSAATVQNHRPNVVLTFRLFNLVTAVLTETWVSDFVGLPSPPSYEGIESLQLLRVSHGVALSSVVIDIHAIQRSP